MQVLEMLEMAKRFRGPDQPVTLDFIQCSLTKTISGELFDGVKLTFDPEFGNIYVTCRGYEVDISLGNTSEWKTKCADGGFDGALSVSAVIYDDDVEEDESGEIVPKNLFHHVLPTLETN